MYAIAPKGIGWIVGREDDRETDEVNSLTYEEAIFAMRALEKRAWDIATKTNLGERSEPPTQQLGEAATTECTWAPSDDFDDDDHFYTECGNEFIIIDGTPKDNEMVFCCYCGKKLVERKSTNAAV